jgi:hypothetical protein
MKPAFSFIAATALSLSLGLAPAGSAHAQSSDDQSADEIIAAGLSALRQIDAGQNDALWDQVSATLKTQLTKPDFTAGLQRARQSVGAVQQRTWASVVRIRYEAGSTTPPPGLYANVDFSTRLKDGRTVFEKVSLRYEPSGWRFSGYVPREQQ